MKALVASASDLYPIRGYHKWYYLLAAFVLLIISVGLLAAVPLVEEQNLVAAWFFFGGNWGLWSADILAAGFYGRAMREHASTGTDLLTWIHLSVRVGELSVAGPLGPVAEDGNLRWLMWYVFGLGFTGAIPLLLAVREEKTDVPRFRWDRLHRFSRLFAMAAVTSLCAIGQALVTMTENAVAMTAFVSITACGLAVCAAVLFGGRMGKPLVYLLVIQSAYLTINGAVEYYYLAPPECVPDGPHFDYTFYVTWANLVGQFSLVAGVAAFQLVFRNAKMRVMFWSTTALRAGASLVDLVIVQRWNTSIGIPDQVMFLMGSAVLYEVVYEMDYLASWMLIVRLCPTGLETTTFAVLNSFSNFGRAVSRVYGLQLTEWLGIRTVVPCDFSRLPWLLIISHMILPCLTIPLTFFLVPDQYMTDVTDLDDAVEGGTAKPVHPGTGEADALCPEELPKRIVAVDEQ